MARLTIDGIEVEVEDGCSVLQACEAAGKEVPRFCYHERLSVAGNCRMCLVEMERAPKPIASCAMPAADGMVIHTDTETVRKAREGVMEFLLINHPLDCPICDQGGECDLQDQAMGYGMANSRFLENKRAVEDKNMGPLIKTIMTRCIHCTRCVRFATEVAGVEELGAIGRGEGMEITTYLEKSLASELSGNVVDLCPVGALTSRPYAFVSRPWELAKTQTIDVMDAVGSNIRVDSRGNQVLRVLPRVNDDVNEEWISDKTRHAIDGLSRQRLDRPYLRGRDGRLHETGWDQAFDAIRRRITRAEADKIAALAGDQMDIEAMFALRQLMQRLDVSSMDCRQDGSVIGTSGRSGYIFNSGFAAIDDADAILLVGCNPRYEAAVVNARIRQRWLHGELHIARIGTSAELTYPVLELGEDPAVLESLAAGKGGFFRKLKSAKKPMIILGQTALNRRDSNAILALACSLAEATGVVTKSWCGFNILHNAAARVGGLDIGFLPGKGGRDRSAILRDAMKGELDVLYLLGADELTLAGRKPGTFIIYQGSHGDIAAQQADVILPGAAFTEKDGLYVNSEGRCQQAQRAVFPPGDAREDWAILRALSAVLKKTLGYDSHEALRAALYKEVPLLAVQDVLTESKWRRHGRKGKLLAAPLGHSIGPGSGRSFYMTCPISRNSTVMAECVASFESQVMKGAAE